MAVKVKPKLKTFDDYLYDVKDLYSQDELNQIKKVFEDAERQKKKKAKLLREIVPIEKWIDDPYYLGAMVHDIFPFWRRVIIDIFSRPIEKRVNQIILTGAIGIGKSTAASIMIIRKIYELSCYENISSKFNLSAISKVAFAYLSVSREQAKLTGYSSLQQAIDQIPYFAEHFPRKENLDNLIIFPQERLMVLHGSVFNHFIGTDLIGSILDEANFFGGQGTEDKGLGANSKVSNLYSQILTRSSSRFIVNGINESLSIVVSSSTNVSSFTEQMISQAAKDPDHTYIVSPAIWEVKPKEFFKRGTFMVYTGGNGFDPQIVENLDDINRYLSAYKHKEVYGIGLEDAYKNLPIDIKSKIIKVPMELWSDFTKNIVVALQNHAGMSSASIRKFFSNAAAFNRCIKDDLRHPFSKQSFKISTTKYTTQEGYMPIQSYFLVNHEFNNKNALRYMHVDLAATGDSIGISMVHISGWKNTNSESTYESHEKAPRNALNSKRETLYDPYGIDALYSAYDYEEDDRVEVNHKQPIIQTDFMLKLDPPVKPERMPISKIRDFIIWLREEKGIRFGKITFDQWGSEQIRQELTELNFPVGYLSVDRTTAPYYTLVDLIFEERMEYYDYQPFREELFNLVEDMVKKKIDHPINGSKDNSDSVAGAVFNAVTADDKTDVDETVDLINMYLDVNSGEDPVGELKKLLMQGLMR